MTRSIRLTALLTVAIAVFAQAPKYLGIDTHIDTAQRILIGHVDIGQRLPDGQVDIPRLKEGGMRAPFFALWVPTYYKGSEAVRRTLDLRDAMQSVFDRYPDQIEMATTGGDVERIVKSGKIAAVLSLEGGHQIADDLAVLRMYQRMGIRAMTLTHFRNNNWADSSTDKAQHNGLTDFGKQVVREMNRIGVIVDISHVSDNTFYDTLAVTTKPVIASHSSSRAIAEIPRNMTDDMLKALARNGGVVGINFGAGFVNPKDARATMANINSMAAKSRIWWARRLMITQPRSMSESRALLLTRPPQASMTWSPTSITLQRSRALTTSASEQTSTESGTMFPRVWRTPPRCRHWQPPCARRVTAMRMWKK